MDFFGVRATEKQTAITAPVTASTAAMVFGTAPVHQTGGKVNEVVLANSYEEAVAAMGWSDDWDKYTICEAIYSHFRLYAVGPLLMVNVLDPGEHKGEEKTETAVLVNGQVKLSGDVLPESVKLDGEYEAGTDYDVFFENGVCIIEALEGGALAEAESVSVTYAQVDFDPADLKDAVIGGYNVKTGQSTGLELADQAYFRTKVLPEPLIAPGFSENTGVAAVMAAKAKSLSIVFRSLALCDLDTAGTENYQTAAEKKSASGAFQHVKERLCWPKLSLDGRKFHLSTQMAGLMCQLAANDGGIPSEPASNKTLQADSTILADGTPVKLDLNMANYLRGQGITTALNFVNGFTSWGEYCACAPGNSDPKDMFCNVTRMVNYIANTVILTYWSYIDRKMTPRLAASIAHGIDIWMNGLKSQEHLLGGRCELLEEENPVSDLMAGIIRPHIYIGVPGPAQLVDFIVEYDAAYLMSVFG